MGDTFRVAIADLINDALEPERSVLDGCATVEALNAHCEEDLAGRIDQVDAMMLYHGVGCSKKTIDRLERCKLIVRCGVGYDNVDLAEARRRGIPVANIPDYGSEEVADSAIGMALALARGISLLNSRLRDTDQLWTYQHAIPLRRLRGRTFGIVGLGRIGTATALRARSLGMNVIFYDPYKADGYDKALGVRRVETLEELLTESFIVSLHCPLTAETHHIIDAPDLARMSQGSYLVNTARGPVVNAAAVVDAIASGRLAGAAIDVLAEEPPADNDPVLLAWRDPKHPAYERLILNPHTAFYAEESLREMRVKGAEACRRALLGLPLRNIVN